MLCLIVILGLDPIAPYCIYPCQRVIEPVGGWKFQISKIANAFTELLKNIENVAFFVFIALQRQNMHQLAPDYHFKLTFWMRSLQVIELSRSANWDLD